MNETERSGPPRLFSVASSPHIGSPDTCATLMLDVILALVPALIAAVFFFGPRALTLTLVSVGSAVGFELLYRLLTRQSVTVGDLSAVVTGLLLAMCLPVQTPYWIAVVGSGFSIVVVKQLFGGLGKNFMNPALAGRVFLFSFPAVMGQYAAPGSEFWAKVGDAADTVSAATPMASLHQGVIPADVSIQQLLVGQHAGCLGEVATLLLMAGGVYLVMRRVITPRIPLCYLGTVALLTYLFPRNGCDRLDWMLYNLLAGGLMLGAIFMATDYVTSPVTPGGQVVYAVGCGALTVFLRYFGSYPEGVSFSILVMNTLVWALDKALPPHRFGTGWFKKTRRRICDG